MVNKEITDYIKQNLNDFSFRDIKVKLLSSGFKEEDVDKAFKRIINRRKISGLTIFLLIIVLIMSLVFIFITYFLFGQTNVDKPDISKPDLPPQNPPDQSNPLNQTNPTDIKAEHLIFLLNEIGAHNLHNSPAGDMPRIDFIISDTNQRYYLGVENNKIIETSETFNPDVVLKADRDTIYEVYNSADTKRTVTENYNNGKIEVNIIADASTLLLKGYSSLSSYFGITGSAVSYYPTNNNLKPIVVILLGALIILVSFYASIKRKDSKLININSAR